MDISTRIALADREYRTLFDLCVKASGAEARQACERRMAEAIFQCFLLRVLRTDNPLALVSSRWGRDLSRRRVKSRCTGSA